MAKLEAALRNIDFTTLQGLVVSLIGLAMVTLIGVGIRLLVMVTIQQRRERANRQINERLRTLIAAYKVLGGSFTGNLAVDPTHLRGLRRNSPPLSPDTAAEVPVADGVGNSERRRRTRDAVEAALSDIILLGTEEHVRLAASAARELVAGREVYTQALVVSLRDFIRDALDLDPFPSDIAIPVQGPTRSSGSGSNKSERDKTGAQQSGGGNQGAGGVGGGGIGGTADSGVDSDTPVSPGRRP